MRAPTFLAVIVLSLATATGCARDVRAAYPATPGEPTGTVELVFTAPASAVSVAVNGVLLVRDRRTERVTITDVQSGYAEVAIAAGPGEKATRVWVEAGGTTAVPLPASGEAPASAIRQFAMSLATVALYALLR